MCVLFFDLMIVDFGDVRFLFLFWVGDVDVCVWRDGGMFW